MTGRREDKRNIVKGRGSASNPTSRFERMAYEPDPDFAEDAADRPGPPTEIFRDASRSIITENDSPDIRYPKTLNPYKGCEHGCIYCYARPYHEYLGLSAGLDFESKLFAKPDAAALLRGELARPRYTPEPLALSGATDPYQPAEKKLRITRQCLELLAECRHPVCIITKSTLVLRDADLLEQLAGESAAIVTLSLTTLDASLQRTLEPRAPTPRARLDAMAELTGRGIPVGVNVSPIIPGLTDHEIPRILEAAAEAGASRAARAIIRLPHGVKELFADWLERVAPLRKDRVLSQLRAMHGGRLYDSRWGKRLSGEGPKARQIADLFALHARRHGLDGDMMPLSNSSFRRPDSGQLELF